MVRPEVSTIMILPDWPGSPLPCASGPPIYSAGARAKASPVTASTNARRALPLMPGHEAKP
jgi:hypothetical protein